MNVGPFVLCGSTLRLTDRIEVLVEPPGHIPVEKRNGYFEGCVYDGEPLEQSDGQFFCVDKTATGFRVFSDYWGRLPLYYALTPGGLIVSRTIVSMLPYLTHIRLDLYALADVLVFGHPLGRSTVIQGVKRLESTHTLIWDGMCRCVKTHDLSFDIIYDDSDERTIELVRDTFVDSVSRRYRVLSQKYKMTADLSAGRDTRMVSAALNKVANDLTFYTMGFCQEEKTARQLASIYGRDVVTTPIVKVDDKCELKSGAEAVYANTCSVNFWTTLLCFRDMQERLRIINDGPVACFGGLGSEVIRHPYSVNGYVDIVEAIWNGQMRRYIAPKDVVRLLDITKYERYLDDHFATYPEKTQDGKARHMMYEYLNRLLGAAEDRVRMGYWYTQPFFSKPMYDIVSKVIPLRCRTEEFFVRMMGVIDSRVIGIPFGESATLNVQKSVKNALLSRCGIKRNELEHVILREYSKLNTRIFDGDGLTLWLAQPRHINDQRQILSVILWLQQMELMWDIA